MVQDVEVGRAADAEAALSASPTAPVVAALPGNDQPRTELDALRSLFTPATRVVVASAPPKVRKSCCAKCPFGGYDLTPAEEEAAWMLKARLLGRMSAGEKVVWGCHETVDNGKPQVCPGFLEYTRERPELSA